MNLENQQFRMVLEQGRIVELVEKRYPQVNLADYKGKFGLACFTRKEEDIRSLPHELYSPYAEHHADYTECVVAGDDRVLCKDAENGIMTEYHLEEDALVITTQTVNDGISGFGMQVDMNFLGKKGTSFREQILPSSPYTSADRKYTYCIMTRPNGRFVVACATTECDGWRICYAPFACAHYTWGFQFLASFDQVYGGSGRKQLSIKLQCVDTLEEAYEKVYAAFGKPMCINMINGGFDGKAKIKLYGQADFLQLQTPSGELRRIPVQQELTLKEFGLHTVTPVIKGEQGLNTTVWHGGTYMRCSKKKLRCYSEAVPLR